MRAHGTGSIPDSCSEHGHYIILKGAYDLVIENLRLVREEFLMEGETDLARVEELLFVDAWRKYQNSQSEGQHTAGKSADHRLKELENE